MTRTVAGEINNAKRRVGRTLFLIEAINKQTGGKEYLTKVLKLEDKQNLLSFAVLKGDFEAASILLSCGVDLNDDNDYKELPLYLAAEEGRIEFIPLLMKFGAKLYKKANYTDERALDVAIDKGDIAIIKELIANSNIADLADSNEFCSYFTRLARLGKTECFEAMMESINSRFNCLSEGIHKFENPNARLNRPQQKVEDEHFESFTYKEFTTVTQI